MYDANTKADAEQNSATRWAMLNELANRGMDTSAITPAVPDAMLAELLRSWAVRQPDVPDEEAVVERYAEEHAADLQKCRMTPGRFSSLFQEARRQGESARTFLKGNRAGR